MTRGKSTTIEVSKRRNILRRNRRKTLTFKEVGYIIIAEDSTSRISLSCGLNILKSDLSKYFIEICRYGWCLRVLRELSYRVTRSSPVNGGTFYYWRGEATSHRTLEIVIFKQVLFIAHAYMHHDNVAMDCRNFLQHNRKKIKWMGVRV